MPTLTLTNLAPGRTATIQRYTRGTQTTVGSAISLANSGYTYSVDWPYTGDFDCVLLGFVDPAPSPFPVRDGVAYPTLPWSVVDILAYDPDIPASTPPRVTGFWRVYDKDGDLEPGASITMKNADVASGASGYVLEDAVRIEVADSNGIASFTNLFVGAKYIAYRTGSNRTFIITIPNQTGPVALGSFTG